jgi:large subunit ribosomal protein L28
MKVKHLSGTALNRWCEVCGKTATSGYNRPHSQHRTKRTIKPNLQKKEGILLCTRCIRTLKGKTSLF